MNNGNFQVICFLLISFIITSNFSLLVHISYLVVLNRCLNLTFLNSMDPVPSLTGIWVPGDFPMKRCATELILLHVMQ